MGKILVDTSAWIASFSKWGHEDLKESLKEKILQNEVCMTGMVLLELLQGTRNEEQRLSLKKRLAILPFLSVDDSIWNQVSQLSIQMRSKGVKAPAPDFFIAQVAILNGCVLWHCDRDFERVAKHCSLQTVSFLPKSA